MSPSRQVARDLVQVYDHRLEQQIVQRGSSLPCRDEDLRMQVEGLLRDGDAPEKHCLGLDALLVMEECLCSRRARTRGELHGLARAFEVLEQAALNLYLGPWRKEYRVIKMYSGTFTHCITPVLSRPQIEQLFGMLGYRPSPAWTQQLCLQSARVSPAVLDDLLRLSCAFFVARCECRLLLSALGKHVGDAEWELSVVRERLKGNSLQVAVDNTKRTLETSRCADGDMDLYREEGTDMVAGDEEEGGDEEEAGDEEAAPPAGGSNSPRGSSAAGTSQQVSAAGMSQQVSAAGMSQQVSAAGTSQQVSGTSHHVSAAGTSHHVSAAGTSQHVSGTSQHVSAAGTSQHVSGTSQQVSGTSLAAWDSEDEPDRSCTCLRSPLRLKLCLHCGAVHDSTCAYLGTCVSEGHDLQTLDPGSPASRSLRPIGFHACCDPSAPDPRALCRGCRVFHAAASCGEWKRCEAEHEVGHLGVCTCGKVCSRKPLILCRYCGTEYCSHCWYQNPITCTCGQTFDQSSSV